jgi:hypothetical protein
MRCRGVPGEGRMVFRRSLAIIALANALSITAASAFDESRYPNFSGVWRKPVGIGNQWDQTKPLGRAKEPPFTPEYQAIFEAEPLACVLTAAFGTASRRRC